MVCVCMVCVCMVSSPSEPVWFEPQVCDFAMTRVFEHHEFEAVAAKASKAAPEDVLRRFYVPIVGTLRCKYIGPQHSDEKDLIVFHTKVRFKWELSSPHVKGSVELAFRCCFVLFVACVESGSPRLLHASAGAYSQSVENQQASTDIASTRAGMEQESKRANNGKQRTQSSSDTDA